MQGLFCGPQSHASAARIDAARLAVALGGDANEESQFASPRGRPLNEKDCQSMLGRRPPALGGFMRLPAGGHTRG
jgi:hypothetical protein